MTSPHELGHDRRAGVAVRVLGYTSAAVGAAMRAALAGIPALGLHES